MAGVRLSYGIKRADPAVMGIEDPTRRLTVWDGRPAVGPTNHGDASRYVPRNGAGWIGVGETVRKARP
jgi:hypothetical protein